MLLLDVVFRYPAITLLLWVAVLAVRDSRHTSSGIYAALLSVSAACLLLGTSHPDLVPPNLILIPSRLLDTSCVVFVWWFGRSLFEDDFRLGRIECLGFFALVIPTLYARLFELGFVSHFPFLVGASMPFVSFLMMAQLFYITINGRHDDVIESRRRARFYFVIALITVTVVILISDRIFYQQFPVLLSVFRAAAILPVVISGLLWLTKLQPEVLTFEVVKTVEVSKPQVDPRDEVLHTQLLELMQEQQAFIEQGLTIKSLADKLKAPEHRLRALINQGLGYRNFSGFLNKYRIDAVKRAMQEPANRRVPVLTLAMEVGYSSLAPFNRAFLSETGQTPSEYRAKLLEQA